jgi:hypothetical protein
MKKTIERDAKLPSWEKSNKKGHEKDNRDMQNCANFSS